MSKNNKAIITISLIGLLIVIVIGASYAFFTANIDGSETASSIITSSGTLSISYAEGDENILISNAYPKDEAWLTKTFTLTGNNTTDLNMNYSVSLNIIENSFDDDDLTYSLTSITPTSGTVIADIASKSINTSGTQVIGYGQFVKGTGITHTYTLSIYFKDNGKNQNASQGAVFSGKIVVAGAGTGDIPILSPDGWEDAGAGTLLAGIKANYSTATSTLTTPGQQISTSDEAVLAYTEDDYGTSYYFRGAVENNYVVFADMCWRIVRITGDGSIKLTLYNYNGDDDSNPCGISGESLAFARYDGDTYTSRFNIYNTSNAYVGFMYGTADSSTYEAEHENKTDSTILTNLKTWYDAVFDETEQSLLADTIWCNDKRITSGTGAGAIKTHYVQYNRFVESSTNSPSLKCGETKSDNKISKFTASDTKYGNGMLKSVQSDGTTKYYKIGLLTADEVAYAGGKYDTENSTYYLLKNASSTYWWSLSPCAFGTNANGSYIGATGSIGNYGVTGPRGMRPAISLVSTATISGGDGTSENPFVIA